MQDYTLLSYFISSALFELECREREGEYWFDLLSDIFPGRSPKNTTSSMVSDCLCDCVPIEVFPNVTDPMLIWLGTVVGYPTLVRPEQRR